MIQTKSKAKGAQAPASSLRASPLSDQRHKHGWLHIGSQKSETDEAKQVSFKICGNERRIALREHRMALEQDVKLLRLSLGRENNLHKILERALQRPIGVLPCLPNYLPPQTRELLAELAVLEEEVAAFENRVLTLQQQLQTEYRYSAVLQERTHWSSYIPLTLKKTPPVFLSAKMKEQKSANSLKVKKDVVVAKLLSSLQDPLTCTSRKFQVKLNKPTCDRTPCGALSFQRGVELEQKP